MLKFLQSLLSRKLIVTILGVAVSGVVAKYPNSQGALLPIAAIVSSYILGQSAVDHATVNATAKAAAINGVLGTVLPLAEAKFPALNAVAPIIRAEVLQVTGPLPP